MSHSKHTLQVLDTTTSVILAECQVTLGSAMGARRVPARVARMATPGTTVRVRCRGTWEARRIVSRRGGYWLRMPE